MSDVGNEGVCECAGAGDIRETSVPFSKFCYKLKTALKPCLQEKKKKRRKPEIMEPIIIKRGKKHSRNVSGSLSIQILCYFSEFIMLSVIVSFLNFLMHCTFFLPSKELVTITLYFVFVILCYFLKEGSKNYKQ